MGCSWNRVSCHFKVWSISFEVKLSCFSWPKTQCTRPLQDYNNKIYATKRPAFFSTTSKVIFFSNLCPIFRSRLGLLGSTNGKISARLRSPGGRRRQSLVCRLEHRPSADGHSQRPTADNGLGGFGCFSGKKTCLFHLKRKTKTNIKRRPVNWSLFETSSQEVEKLKPNKNLKLMLNFEFFSFFAHWWYCWCCNVQNLLKL